MGNGGVQEEQTVLVPQMGSGFPPAAAYHKPVALFVTDIAEFVAKTVPFVVVAAPKSKKQNRPLVFFDEFKKITQGNLVINKGIVKTIAPRSPFILPVGVGFPQILAAHEVVHRVGRGIFSLILDRRHFKLAPFFVQGFVDHHIKPHVEELPLGAYKNPFGAKGKHRGGYFFPRQERGVSCSDMRLSAIFCNVGRGKFGVGTNQHIVVIQEGNKLLKLAFYYPVGPFDKILCRRFAFYHTGNVVKSLEKIVKLRGLGQFLKKLRYTEKHIVAPSF
jgi:hypothetical protein